MSGKSFKQNQIYLVAEQHSVRFHQVANDVAKTSWAHDDAMRAVYHARTQAQLTEALEKLAELNASYVDRPLLDGAVCR